MARLTDPDRLSAYRDALSNWQFTDYIKFELSETAHAWIRNSLGIPLKEIGRLMYEFVDVGGEIDEVRETRPGWRDDYEFHYDLRFRIGSTPVYIESRLIYRLPVRPDQPHILVVNVHDP